jgi:hypothetical protein
MITKLKRAGIAYIAIAAATGLLVFQYESDTALSVSPPRATIATKVGSGSTHIPAAPTSVLSLQGIKYDAHLSAWFDTREGYFYPAKKTVAKVYHAEYLNK